jgi:hypothetical protein
MSFLLAELAILDAHWLLSVSGFGLLESRGTVIHLPRANQSWQHRELFGKC